MDPQARAAMAAIRDGWTESTRLAVLSGAGISAASGIPTFRGAKDSLWHNHRVEDLATPEAFARDPELVWRWYDWRRALIAQARPNAGHHALVKLAGEVDRLTIITQNVDGLHSLAGSREVLEFHGSIWRLRCLTCRREAEDRRVPLPIPPRCSVCGGLLRPGVVWFGEGIDPEILSEAAAAVRSSCALIVVGTSGAVYPAAGLVALARDSGAHVLEFNVERSAISSQVDLFVPGSAAETLPLFLS